MITMPQCDVSKCLLFFFNGLYFLLAIFKISLASTLLTETNQIDSRLTGHCIFGVVIGIFLVILSILGFYGIYKNKTWMLRMFVFGASIIAIIHTMLAVMAFATAYRMDDNKTKMAIANMFNNYDKHKDHVDRIQKRLKCCGLDGPHSWESNIPDSCCKDPPCSESTAFGDSCTERLVESYKKIKLILAIVATVIAVLSCILTSVTFYVARGTIKRRETLPVIE